MIPRRFSNLAPYFASFVHKRFERPPLGEMFRWIFQPGKEARAAKYIQTKTNNEKFLEVIFKNYDKVFYYPVTASWVDLCQTIDECFNPDNWHHFISPETPIGSDDVVVDCGAAEGLFSIVAAQNAKMVYAIEPVPFWHESLNKTFQHYENIELMPYGVGHKNAEMQMTNDEIYSRITSDGGIRISVRTLDCLFFEKDIPVSFIKADVEGFEFQTLLGAENLIRKNRPKISITVYHDTNHFLEIMDYLRNIHQDYTFKLRGIAANGNPILLQAY
ncbi:MAG: FkbM family methyltransferase [Akkermansiaceae bacterium]|jgi:FkbM family methyltransferase